MPGDLVPTEPLRAGLAVSEVDLFTAALLGLAQRTAAAYASDYRDFAGFLKVPGPKQALDTLVSFSVEAATYCVLAYGEHLRLRKLAPATIARRIAALRSACRLAKRVGRITWDLAVDGPRAEAYRDTAGPGLEGWKQILATAKSEATTPFGRRNLALVRLLHDLGLRRGESVGIDLADLQLNRNRLAITGKGRTGQEWITVPNPVWLAIGAWLGDRGRWPGPLFVGLGTGRIVEGAPRLTGEGVRLMVASLARRAGVAEPVRPHGLRHQAVTEALDRTNGDVRKVARFSRHRKVETVLRYDDNRQDLGGEVAGLISDE